MEEIDNDEVNRQLTGFVFSCDLEELFLCLIAELALPETETVLRYGSAPLVQKHMTSKEFLRIYLWHHRNSSRNTSIRLNNLGGSFSRHKPTVQDSGAHCLKGHDVFAEHSSPDTRVVPE